jgi:hypothetical protein
MMCVVSAAEPALLRRLQSCPASRARPRAGEEGVELVLDETRRLRASVGLDVGDEDGRMLLH